MRIPLSVALIAAAAFPACAQSRRGAIITLQIPGSSGVPKRDRTDLERLERMSPAQRQQLFRQLPPDRARSLQDRLDRLDQMPPGQREHLNEQYEWFQQLPPDKQNAMRKVFRRYSDLSSERRGAVGKEFRSLRELKEDDRRKRMDSEDFRSEFNKDERKLLEDMTAAVPE
jgi:hypothetical protein